MCDLRCMTWLSLPLLIDLHHTSLPLCTMPGTVTCPCSEFCFLQSIESFSPLSFNLWGKWMDVDGKIHVDTGKPIIFTLYSLKLLL